LGRRGQFGAARGVTTVTTTARRDPLLRRLDEAEGYIMLDLPERALAILESRPAWGSVQFAASVLKGEALRRLGRWREALTALERAARIDPTHVSLAIALGWCYKRTHRLAQAIDALERSVREHPEEPLLHYNLACYWSLAGQIEPSIKALVRAVDLDRSLCDGLANEPDLAAVRAHPVYRRLAEAGARECDGPHGA
jgi:tetratricopeptide (TPR) repeat protein